MISRLTIELPRDPGISSNNGTANQPVYPVSSLLSVASRKSDNDSFALDFFLRQMALYGPRFHQ